MKKIKRIIMTILLFVEMTVFAYFAYTGKHGIKEIKQQQKIYTALQKENEQLAAEVTKLQTDVSDWKKYPFYAEQYARQHLQMARAQDEVYITA